MTCNRCGFEPATEDGEQVFGLIDGYCYPCYSHRSEKATRAAWRNYWYRTTEQTSSTQTTLV